MQMCAQRRGARERYALTLPDSTIVVARRNYTRRGQGEARRGEAIQGQDKRRQRERKGTCEAVRRSLGEFLPLLTEPRLAEDRER